MTTNHEKHQSSISETEESEEGFSLRDLVDVARKHGVHIAATLGILAALYVIGALSLYLSSPSRKVTTLAFRLEFRGAERGQYPNGMRFSPTEILSTPVLLSVYKSNRLDQFCGFESFKSSLFVLESNEALELLNRAYQSKLADVRLSVPERETLEKEFADKKASLGHASYAITLLTDGDLRLPSSVRPKILNDVLATWAEQTVHDKGVALYDLSILSSGIFERNTLDSYDYVIALAMVRSKINRVLANIDQLLDLPGAKVVRTPKTNLSLAELRVRLEDSLNFKVQPLVGIVMSSGLSKDPEDAIKFMETQLTFNDLARQEAESRTKTIRDALTTYLEQQQANPSEERGRGGSEQPLPSQTVIPQIGDTFLDRLVDLTGKDTDTRYRQDLVDEMKHQSLLVVPLEAEANYYRTLLGFLRQFQNRARPATPEEQAVIQAKLDAVVNEAITMTDQVNEIYAMVSKNLNPSTVLYTSGAVVTSVERPISLARLLLIGLLSFCVALPLIIIGVVLYERLNGKTENVDPEIAPAKTEAPAATKEIEAV